MSIEELLKPRIKMIAPVPEYGMKVGTVITENNDLLFELTPTYRINLTGIRQFTHIYRELEWWEDREGKDMPKYVKSVNNDEIGKVLKWGLRENLAGALVGNYWWFTPRILPATLDEYEQYQQSKK